MEGSLFPFRSDFLKIGANASQDASFFISTISRREEMTPECTVM